MIIDHELNSFFCKSDSDRNFERNQALAKQTTTNHPIELQYNECWGPPTNDQGGSDPRGSLSLFTLIYRLHWSQQLRRFHTISPTYSKARYVRIEELEILSDAFKITSLTV